MTRSYAMLELLNHGALTRQELIEITGWTPKQVKNILSHLLDRGQIKSEKRKWHLQWPIAEKY
jgi:transcription initiation factor IIE alpha subunit